jgi:hypothetical protein
VSEEKALREKALADTQIVHDKAVAANDELRAKIAEAAAQQQDEEEMLDQGGDSREDLTAAKAELAAEVKALAKALEAYSDNDPTELERKRAEIKAFKADADICTDDILAMDGWFVSATGGDVETLDRLRLDWYDREFDEETRTLKDLD